jgi:hypothetical protein
MTRTSRSQADVGRHGPVTGVQLREDSGASVARILVVGELLATLDAALEAAPDISCLSPGD